MRGDNIRVVVSGFNGIIRKKGGYLPGQLLWGKKNAFHHFNGDVITLWSYLVWVLILTAAY